MAANSSSRAVVSLGKRLVLTQISIHDLTQSSRSLSTSFRRSVHASVYDKNVEDQIRPAIVPDYVIESQSEKYWAPHPHTGVFGPATEVNPAVGSNRGLRNSPAAGNGGSESVLEQTAFFRPLEDLDKPEHP
ncbi:hypothetical protein Ancab_009598 [Ancistrocladus abbreviatus]